MAPTHAEVASRSQVLSDVVGIEIKAIRLHHVRFCCPVPVIVGELCDEVAGTTDHVEWVPLGRALTLPPIAPFVTEVLEEEAVRASARAPA